MSAYEEILVSPLASVKAARDGWATLRRVASRPAGPGVWGSPPSKPAQGAMTTTGAEVTLTSTVPPDGVAVVAAFVVL